MTTAQSRYRQSGRAVIARWRLAPCLIGISISISATVFALAAVQGPGEVTKHDQEPVPVGAGRHLCRHLFRSGRGAIIVLASTTSRRKLRLLKNPSPIHGKERDHCPCGCAGAGKALEPPAR